jgi:DNA-binding NarL/FixJ family response regulator
VKSAKENLMNETRRHKDATPVTVLLIDQNPVCRDGIKSMLAGTEFFVVGEAASGAEGVRQANALQPHLVLLDVQLEDGIAWPALGVLRAGHPQTPVVMLSTYDNPIYMAQAAARSVVAYLLKSTARDEFLATLRAVVRGEPPHTPPGLTHALHAIGEAVAQSPEPMQPLSRREVGVLRLLALGHSNREIADELSVAPSTIKTHVHHIINKLGVSSRLQAAVWAARLATTSEDATRE